MVSQRGPDAQTQEKEKVESVSGPCDSWTEREVDTVLETPCRWARRRMEAKPSPFRKDGQVVSYATERSSESRAEKKP